MIDLFVPLLVVAPLTLATLCILIRNARCVWGLAVACSLFVLIASLQLLGSTLDGAVLTHAFGGWQAPWGIAYRIDIFNAFIAVLLGLVFTPILFFARTSIEQESPGCRHDVFFALCLLLLSGLLGVTVSDDLFNIYVFLEVASLASYALVAFTHRGTSALSAFRYLVIGTLASTLFLLGVGYLYFLTGTLNLSEMKILFAQAHQNKNPAIWVGLMFLSAGLILKAAIFPLHQWLPGAYTHAPVSISALLSASSTKIAILLWVRLLFGIFPLPDLLPSIALDNLLMVLAAGGILFGSVLAIRQNNVKTMLAYSSIAQSGYIFLGFLLLSPAGMSAGILYLWNHALIKAGLFLALGCALYRCQDTQLETLQGLHQRMPVTAAMIGFGGLSLIGVPLSSGFISKWFLVSALWDAQNLWGIGIVLLGSLLSVVYVWRIVELMYFHPGENTLRQEAPATLLLPCAFVLGLVLYFGIMPGSLIGIIETLTTVFLQHDAAL